MGAYDQSKYSTMYTAFDFGDWKSTYRPQPDPIPVGQYEAYFKFNIDTYEMVYAYISLYGDYGEQALEVLSSSGETLDVAYTEATGGVITSPIWGNRLIVDADGTQGNTIYLHVIRGNPLDSSAYMVPGINSRLQSNYGTFSFTGTANNSGNSLSTSIYCDLTNNSRVPQTAIVDSISTSGGLSPSVAGVTQYLNPGGRGWVESRTSGTRGSFELGPEYGINVRQRWEFMYAQTAFASTKMTNIKMTIYWHADIKENNYELWTTGPIS